MADSNTQNDNGQVINLAQVQKMEQEKASNDDILASEDELLGLNKPPSSSTGGGTTTATGTSKYHIPQVVKEQYPELIPLIIQTESMDDEEREYWFQILPIMTDDQIAKLKEILVGEKKQLAKLDEEYEQELAKINEKHLEEWQAFENQQVMAEIEAKESEAEATEANLEEELLNKLDEL